MKTGNRLTSLDLLKGISIFSFIIWHVFENFYSYKSYEAELHRMQFFVTGYFVLSSGFMIGTHYYQKIINGIKWTSFFKRICVRALKLFFFVFVAGMVMRYLKDKSFSLKDVFIIIQDILSLSYKDRWDISMQVLIAVAVTLIFGYIIMIFFIKIKVSILISLAVLVILAVTDYNSSKHIPYLWRYVLHGLVGVEIGMIFHQYIYNGDLQKKQIYVTGITLFCIFLPVEFCVAYEKIFYEYMLFKIGPGILAVSIYAISLSLIFYARYDIEKASYNWATGGIIIAGNNSLFVYLLQISIINFLKIIFKIRLDYQIECFVYSVIIFSVCIIICKFVIYLRCNTVIDRLYQISFK